MTEAATARPAKRKGRSRGMVANRFKTLSGGDPVIDSAIGEAESSSSGLIPTVSTLVAAEGLDIVQLRVEDLAPHPFNDPKRSRPQPGNPKWEELRNGVSANGVRLPILVVSREAFAAARPAVAAEVPDTAQYVVIYGHRRRIAALETGRETVPAHVDDSVMDNDGDLDAMATENLGREDLSEFAEAELYARYSELGLTARQIGERLGVDGSTVSRRLGLNMLAPEVHKAAVDGVTKRVPDDSVPEGYKDTVVKLPMYEAAALGSGLPYGPPRKWQKTKTADQATEGRRQEQVRALHLILDRNMTTSRAIEHVEAERQARARAKELGIEIVEDPRAALGENYYERRIYENDLTPDIDVIGAIDPGMGTLALYRVGSGDETAVADQTERDQPERTPTPEPDDADVPSAPKGPEIPATPTSIAGENLVETGDNGLDDVTPEEKAALAEQENAELIAAKAAQAHRRQACAALITQPVSNADLLNLLAGQYVSGVAARAGTSAVKALLRDWDAHVEGSGPKARYTRAWHRAVAAAELHLSELKDKAWDDDAVAHLKLLIDRAGYRPTRWERGQLDAATR